MTSVPPNQSAVVFFALRKTRRRAERQATELFVRLNFHTTK
jgi:hypothetical protein